MSYASAAAKGLSTTQRQSTNLASQIQPQKPEPQKKFRKRSPSPAHVPKTGSEEQHIFVLTLLTNKAHHAKLTKLREQYFPARLNKLAAHLTLFHALPGSKIESDIIPVLRKVASSNTAFEVHAARPIRLRRGIAIGVPQYEGEGRAQEIHNALQQPWAEAGFLSDQDAGGCRIHYTIMNKVDDDAEIDKAFQEVSKQWKGDWGVAEGLGLFRYERGHWEFMERFNFRELQ